MAKLLILVGTGSGTARQVADAVVPVLHAAGHAVASLDAMASLDDLRSSEVVLVISASRGKGEVPPNLRSLADALERTRPDLSQQRYGVIALGDRAFRETFCGGGRTLDRLLAACGARKLGTRLEIDASTQPQPETDALAWLAEWKTHL